MIWCLHGAVGMAEDWSGFADRIAALAGQKVRPVDLWEFVADGGCSFEKFGAALCDRVQGEDPDPVLLGYSLGGRLGLHALLEQPCPWRAAVIVSAHPGLPDERDRIVRMGDDAQWAADALTVDWGEFLRKWHGQRVLGGPEVAGFGDRERLEGRRKAVARGFMEWSLGKQEDLRPRLGGIRCPVLWVNGAEDEKFFGLGGEAVSALEDARQVGVPGAGHRVPWEAPEEFAQEVAQFLGEVLRVDWRGA